MGTVRTNPYLTHRVARAHPQLRLFCFPYAGGNANVFQRWHRIFPESIEICPLQYPGRGNRMREPPFTSLIPLALDISTALEPLLDLPFAFFGHSMGALIAFELAHELRRKRNKLPGHLFASASRAPQFRSRDRIAFTLPEPQFIEELRRLNGTPIEVLENKELMDLMLPLLRADFSVAQTYECHEQSPLSCPVSAFGGKDDPSVSIPELEGWREQTANAFSLQMFDGDHFYLHASEKVLIEALLRQLPRVRQGAPKAQ
jgi:medium-chain acyl-[acyl-carrier-protein] hydrolase